MSKYSSFFVLSSVLLFVLLASLAYPVAAYADDGTTPPPATEEPVQPPAEASQEPAATEAPVVTMENPAPEEVAATEVPIEKAAGALPAVENEAKEPPAETTVAEVLEAAPEGTEV